MIDPRSCRKGTVNQIISREPEENETERHEAKTSTKKHRSSLININRQDVNITVFGDNICPAASLNTLQK